MAPLKPDAGLRPVRTAGAYRRVEFQDRSGYLGREVTQHQLDSPGAAHHTPASLSSEITVLRAGTGITTGGGASVRLAARPDLARGTSSFPDC